MGPFLHPFARLVDELRFLLDGDPIFLRSEDGGRDEDGGGDGGGSGSGGAQGGAGGGSQEDDDDRPGGDGEHDQPETISAEDARKLRSENRNLRQRAKDAEKKLGDHEREQLDENERLKKDIADRDKRLADLEARDRNSRIREAALAVGVDPRRTRAAAGLIDWEDVDTDDEKAIEAELKALKKEHEYLFASDGQGGGGNGKRGGDADGGRRSDRSGSGDDVTPGIGRLRHYHATKN